MSSGPLAAGAPDPRRPWSERSDSSALTLIPAPTPDGESRAPARFAARRIGRLSWPQAALAVLGLAALALFYFERTYPSYDGSYALVWAREIVHGHLPDFQVPAAPTEHPMAIVLGIVSLAFGAAADRVFVLFSIVSFIALVGGVYTLTARAFSATVGLVAALLLLGRVDLVSLASRGFVDVPFLALVIWAAAEELRYPRAGWRVYGLLTAAGLFRPEAWIFAGLYWLYRASEEAWPARIRQALVVAVAPFVWFLLDLIVTGHPLYSLTATRDLAGVLGRDRSLPWVVVNTPDLLANTVKRSVLIAGIAGGVYGVYVFRRRAAVPLALGVIGVATFWATTAFGLSVNVRYLSVPSVIICIGAALAVSGWTLAEGRLRQIGIGLAVVMLALMLVRLPTYHRDVTRLRSTMTFVRKQHDTLVDLLDRPAVRRGLAQCGVMTVPSHQNVPIVREIMGASAAQIEPATFQTQRPTHGLQLLSIDPRFRVKHGPVGRNNPWRNHRAPGFHAFVQNTSWRLVASRCGPGGP